jgi:hypothetical protein
VKAKGERVEFLETQTFRLLVLLWQTFCGAEQQRTYINGVGNAITSFTNLGGVLSLLYAYKAGCVTFLTYPAFVLRVGGKQVAAADGFSFLSAEAPCIGKVLLHFLFHTHCRFYDKNAAKILVL